MIYFSLTVCLLWMWLAQCQTASFSLFSPPSCFLYSRVIWPVGEPCIGMVLLMALLSPGCWLMPAVCSSFSPKTPASHQLPTIISTVTFQSLLARSLSHLSNSYTSGSLLVLLLCSVLAFWHYVNLLFLVLQDHNSVDYIVRKVEV